MWLEVLQILKSDAETNGDHPKTKVCVCVCVRMVGVFVNGIFIERVCQTHTHTKALTNI